VANLLSNAVRYSRPGTHVRVRASVVELESGAPGLRVDVRDEGPGIAPEHLPRLFERFYRVDKARSRGVGGTGLGLAIVKHIASAHGGTVEVESELGRGSTFSILLPLGVTPPDRTPARDGAGVTAPDGPME
jgi:two-component system phosphate regulon sensor histidine kinase PhoR